MTAERARPDAEPSEEDLRYSLRILREIDSQQKQISAEAAGQARLSAARLQNIATQAKPHSIETARPGSRVGGSAASQEKTSRASPQHNTEKEFHRREQTLRRKLELQKWHGKYNAMLIEASPEHRLGALIRKIAGDDKDASAVRVTAYLGNLSAAEAGAIHSEIERILSEGRIMEELLPLLDPLPNI